MSQLLLPPFPIFQAKLPARTAPSSYIVTLRHGGVTPPTSTNPKAGVDTNDLYESKLTISGPGAATASFRASIFPDDLSVKGRLDDGSYALYLGFHKRVKPKADKSDLVPRAKGFRACLVVEADRPVPVESKNPTKTTSKTIHVHNGYRNKRYSEGCPTLHPDDWARFIQFFLDTYPSLADWTAVNPYLGKQIGSLVVKP